MLKPPLHDGGLFRCGDSETCGDIAIVLKTEDFSGNFQFQKEVFRGRYPNLSDNY